MKVHAAKRNKHLAYQLDKMLTDVFSTSKARQYMRCEKQTSGRWVIGNYIIVEKPHKLYDILHAKNKKALYQDIYCADAAIALVENLNCNRKSVIVDIEKAEKQYANSYNDVICFRKIIEENAENSDVYRHRYSVSMSKMKAALDKIKRYRILNFDK